MAGSLRFERDAVDSRIGVITQYKSHSLLRHLQRGWAFLKTEMNEFVDLLLR